MANSLHAIDALAIDRLLRTFGAFAVQTGVGPPVQYSTDSPHVFFVDNGHANRDDGNPGTDPNFPISTIQQAVDNCSNGRGDVIVITPGTNYAENVVITSKNDVALIARTSKGNSKRVAIAPTAGIALDVAQSNRLTVIGVRCVGTSAVGVRSDGEAGYFENCDFTSDTTHGFQFIGATDTDFTGSGTVFDKCVFRECGGAGLRLSKGTGVVGGIQATNVNVLNCQFYLNTGDDIDDDAGSGSPTYFYQWEISGCKFMSRNKTVYLDMDGGVSAECLICFNFFAEDSGLNATKIALAAGAVFAGNFQAAGVVDGSTF